MKFYYLIGVLLKPLSAVGFFIYGHLTHTPRVRVVAWNERDELLLVKNWLGGSEWSLPGGGVDRGESPENAAARELEEETGITVPTDELRYLFSIRSSGHDEIVYGLRVKGDRLADKVPNPFEIQDMAWFPPADLPKLGSLAQQVVRKMDFKP